MGIKDTDKMAVGVIQKYDRSDAQDKNWLTRWARNTSPDRK